MPIPHPTTLDDADAWSRLRSQSFGRLAVSIDGQPDIFPLNFLATQDGILLRTEPGTKVDDIAANPRVAFEVDHADEHGAWSVVIRGDAHRVADEESLRLLTTAPLWAWAPGEKSVFLRVVPSSVSGRMFAR